MEVADSLEADGSERKRAREVVIVGVEDFKKGDLGEDEGRKWAGKDVVGDVEEAERSEVGELEREFSSEVVGGDGEVDEEGEVADF